MPEVNSQTLQDQIENSKLLIEKRRIAQRLMANPDFRSVILEGFCTVEAARYVQNSVNELISAENRADSLGMAQASGYLKKWLRQIEITADMAERDLPNLYDAIEQARLEEGHN